MLDPVCTETMLIKTFGSENCSTQLCEAVELEVSQVFGLTDLERNLCGADVPGSF